MATISNTPRPGYVWDSADNVWYPIGVGAHQHTNAADTPAVMPYSTYAAAGKNKILNGDFSIWQRGTSLSVTTNAGAFLADRFLLNFAGTFTGTMSQQTFTPGAAPVSGYEAQNFLRIVRTGTTSVAPTFYQRIENVRTLAGQTVTFSFWAKADASRNVTLNYYQSFGSGGSGGVTAGVGTASLTTSWQRFTFTFNMPSVSGKTIGADSWTTVYFDLPDSTAFTFDVWGMQLEAGSTATAFQTATGNIASELDACKRYCNNINYSVNGKNAYNLLAYGRGKSSGLAEMITNLNVPMRVAPTSVTYSGSIVLDNISGAPGVTGITLNQSGTDVVLLNVTVASGLTAHQFCIMYPNSDASVNLIFSAEF